MKPINADARIKAFKAQPMRGMIIDKVELLTTDADLQFERTENDMVIKRTSDFMTDKPLCFKIKLL